jgi:hypothetical protein
MMQCLIKHSITLSCPILVLDFRLSLLLTFDANAAVGCLYRVDEGSATDVSVAHVASIFRVEV